MSGGKGHRVLPLETSEMVVSTELRSKTNPVALRGRPPWSSPDFPSFFLPTHKGGVRERWRP